MNDVFIWKVGKHAGRPITDLPDDFLTWVVTKAERIFPESKQAAAKELERRKVEGAPAVQAAARVFDGEVAERRPRRERPQPAPGTTCPTCGQAVPEPDDIPF